MLWRRSACSVAMLLLFALAPARAGEPFPFGSELMLEGETSHQHKRLPMIEIEENGTATLDLWCGSARARASVGEDGAIAITPSDRDNGQCDANRVASDDDLLDKIAHATQWRRRGDVVELSGATTLRYRMMTN